MKKCAFKPHFYFLKNLTQDIILENPFLTLIQPFTIAEKGIILSIKGKRVRLKFCLRPEEVFFNQLEKVIKDKKKIDEISYEIKNMKIQRILSSKKF